MKIEQLAGGRIRAQYGDQIIKILMAEFPNLYLNDTIPEDYQFMPIINGVLIAYGEEMI
jgi:hypothetical protein